jgi:predicted SAM-dependent methyltransferase
MAVAFFQSIYNASPRSVVTRLRAFVLTRRSQAAIKDYLQHHSVRKLQLSGGSRTLDGWFTTDLTPIHGQAYLNVLKPFPIPTASFNYIGSEHGFEHISYDEGQAMLKECYRILMPGGTLRIATPNLLRLVDLFKKDKTDEELRFIQNKLKWHKWKTVTECSILNYELGSWGHKFVYDPDTLRLALENAGFRDVREFPVGESDIPELRGIEARDLGDIQYIREANSYETMVMQAVRP